MCKLCDSIQAVSDAADQLTAVCQAVLALPRIKLAAELREAFPPMTDTPEDMKALLRRIR